MGGKTEKFTYSGSQPVISGLIIGLSIDGVGQLRGLNLLNDANSGTVTVCVYSDSGLVVTYGTATLVSGGSVNVDSVGSALQASGMVLVSGNSAIQSIGFASNLGIAYFKSSGSVTLTALCDINKSIMPS